MSVGSPVHKSVHKPPGGVRRRRRVGPRLLDLVGQRRIDLDAALGRQIEKALREIDVAGRQRSADFMLRNALGKDVIERPVADRHRIVGGCKPLRFVDGIAADDHGHATENDGAQQRKYRMAYLPDE